MDINVTHFPDKKITKPAKGEAEENELDESLSLRDFPLTYDEPQIAHKRDSSSKIQDKRRSSSEPSEFFEFFNDFTSEMSNAEDIIFRGKLVPYRNPPHQILKSLSADDATHISRRCCDESTQFNSVRSSNIAGYNNKRPSRQCRSMDCKRVRRRDSSLLTAADGHRSFPKTAEGLKSWKPRWFVMMFGPLKLQPEMDLRDMKSRQVRRSPGSLFGGGKGPGSGRSFWGHDLLKVLSCKTHASVTVTTSIGFMPHY